MIYITGWLKSSVVIAQWQVLGMGFIFGGLGLLVVLSIVSLNRVLVQLAYMTAQLARIEEFLFNEQGDDDWDEPGLE